MFIEGDTLPQAPVQAKATDEAEIDAAGATAIGQERRRNEDQFLIATLHRNLRVRSSSIGDAAGKWLPGSVEGMILMVADGMGGHGGGDVASAVAVRAVAEYLCSVMHWSEFVPAVPRPTADSLPGVREGLRSAVYLGDREVRRAGRKEGSPDMGTTLTMAYVRFPLLYIAHVGDTRCYLLRNGQLSQLTRDHTLAEEIREKNGGAEVIDASAWEHILSNALGGGDGVMARPDILRHRLEFGDVVLLCSDGLTKHIDDLQLVELLNRPQSAADASALLVKSADVAGGSDNITAVVARCLKSAPQDLDLD